MSEAAAHALEKLLDRHEPGIRAAAAMGLAPSREKPGPKLLAALAEMIADTTLDQAVRMDALTRVHDQARALLPQAAAALVRQLGDPSPYVRRAAVELLQVIAEDTPVAAPAPPGR